MFLLGTEILYSKIHEVDSGAKTRQSLDEIKNCAKKPKIFSN